MRHASGLCILVITLCVFKNAYMTCDNNNEVKEIAKYTINLDLPARERFKEITKIYTKEIGILVEAQK